MITSRRLAVQSAHTRRLYHMGLHIHTARITAIIDRAGAVVGPLYG